VDRKTNNNKRRSKLTMKFNNKEFKKLKSEQKWRQKHLIKSLVDGKVNSAKADAEWIRLSNNSIAQYKNRLRSYWAAGIGIICLVIIGLAFAIHIRSANVSVEVLAYGITVWLADEWQSENAITGDLIYVDKVNSVSSSLKPELYKSSEPSYIEFAGKDIELKDIRVQKDAEMDIHCFRKELDFYIKRTGLSGKVPMRNGTVQINETSDTINIPLNRPKITYTFHSNPEHAVPGYIRLNIENVKKLKLKGFNVNKLTFLAENPPGSGIFESTLQQGKIVLYDTKGEIDVLENENMVVEFKDCRQAKLFLKDGKMGIKLLGKVTTLAGGVRGFTKNYKPTFLEYLYNNQPLALFWSALIFLFGLLWSVKNTIFTK
jgi:hypothetical protein